MSDSLADIRNERERQEFLMLLIEVSGVVEQGLAREAGLRASDTLPTRHYRWLLESLGGVVLAFFVACVTSFLSFFIFSSVLHLSF